MGNRLRERTSDSVVWVCGQWKYKKNGRNEKEKNIVIIKEGQENEKKNRKEAEGEVAQRERKYQVLILKIFWGELDLSM